MTNPLDEGAIPSTSIHLSANWPDDADDVEIESYVYDGARLVPV